VFGFIHRQPENEPENESNAAGDRVEKDGFALIEESIPLLWEGTQHVSFSGITPQNFYANVAIFFNRWGFSGS
jgi:hypothetical protein